MGYFSNGTEGAVFEEQFCSRCIHYDHEPGADKPCPVWMAHLLHAYDLSNEDPEENPGKQILDMLIRRIEVQAGDGLPVLVNECQMFVEAKP